MMFPKYHSILVACFFCFLAHSVESGMQLERILIYITMDQPIFFLQIKDDSGKFVCAGSLISNEFAITAAQCFNDLDHTEAVVIAGAAKLSDEGVRRKIAKVFIHPDYENTTNYADLAVIKLNEPYVLDENIIAVELCEGPMDNLRRVHVYGWRHMSTKVESGKIYSTSLATHIVDKCARTEYNLRLEDKQLCVEGMDYDNQYAVSDIGGAAIYNRKLIGLAVGCTKCDEIDYTNKFVHACYFYDFITDSMSR